MQRILFALPLLIFLALAAYVTSLAIQDLMLGGNAWKQGDWLINNNEITVRRGIIGSAILFVAQQLGSDPVAVTVFLQIAILLMTTGLVAAALVRAPQRHLLWLLLLCPGFFVSFWALDDQGGLRKELIVFLALAMMLFAAARPTLGKVWVYLSAAVFGIAVLGHEGNVFFAPFFGFFYYRLWQQGKLSRPDLIALGGFIGAACLTAVAIAVLFSNVTDHMAVCRPLLAAGVDPVFCEGAIKALEIPLSDFLQTTFWMFFSPRILSFVLLYGLTALFIVGVGSLLFDRKAVIIAYGVSACLFLPLYIVAVDWGRWVSFHSTAVIFTMLILVVSGDRAVRAHQPLAPATYALLLIYPLVWGFSHFVDVIWGGIVWKVVQQVMLI